MIKVYIPFNMIIDLDAGVVRLTDILQNVSSYSNNKLKSFLINRQEENPLIEYNKERSLDIEPGAYETILGKERYYKQILPLSLSTDLLSFVINTSKLGYSKELSITIGCDSQMEIDYLELITSQLEYSFDMEINMNINLNDFDYLFTKYFDDNYVNYITNVLGISGKRIYIADYNFNTIYDKENDIKVIDPILHMDMESNGNVLCLISLYNKKQ